MATFQQALTTLRTPQEAAQWLRARVGGQLHADSRQVQAQDGFIAWPGAAVDGRRFVESALTQGAAACLVEQEGVEAFGFDDERIAVYRGLKSATSLIGDAYYGSPSAALQMVAVTGTNGKTSTAWWLAGLLAAAQWPQTAPCGLVGTLGVGVPPEVQPTGLTTPDPVLLHRRLREFVDQGVKSCAIEASSIGIVEHRLDGLALDVAVFTNFTQDHLDYHQTMEAYWQAKRALFGWPGLRAAVINLDDPRGAELEVKATSRGLEVWTVSLTQPARLSASDLSYCQNGMAFNVTEGGQTLRLETELIGDYNVSNILCAFAAMRALGLPLQTAVSACSALSAVPGRMEQVGGVGQPLAVIDYAHTADALEKALTALRPLATQRGGKLWCVFGCGGNRDASKRPLMAAAAQARADMVCVTSDNPRDEAPQAIIQAVLGGVNLTDQVRVEPDRARAIASALAEAAAADVVLIAGKGHEDYQEIEGQRFPFSDQAQARAALEARASGAQL